MKQGEGTFVKQFEAEQLIFPLSIAILMNKQDISHLLEVRKIIETGTAASAANNRNTEDLAIMAEALEEMKQVGTSDEELGEKADLKFHLALSAASRNPILSTLLDQVSELMVETMRETRRIWFFSKQTTIEKLYQEHLQIYQAIVEKDEEKARKTMISHIENVENILKKYFHEAIDKQ